MKDSGSKQPLTTLRNAGVRTGQRWLVEDVSFSISRGEIVTLIGPNGAGKSTTARMVTGVLKPTAGSVDQPETLRIGYVPQKLSIDWTLPLTVRRLMVLTDKYTRTEIDAALDAVGVRHLAEDRVQTLSGGEFQRVLLARAIIRKPDLLVLDEPVQGVDYANEVALYKLIADIRDQKQCGVLMISHDLHVVMADTDQVICLNGHICCQGTPDVVSQSPEYLSLFGARASNSLAVYQHHHDHTHLPDGRVRHADGRISEGHEANGHDHA